MGLCFSNYSQIESLRQDDTALIVPCRSPLVVLDVIKPYIEGKVVCEIGSALGDIALRMRKYAKQVIGIEIDEERTEYSKKRGLDTRKGDALSLLPLPEKIDVYYMWMDSETTPSIFNKIEDGVVIMAAEMGYEPEETNDKRGRCVNLFDKLHKNYPQSKMFEIPYNEGPGKRQSGVLVLLAVDKG